MDAESEEFGEIPYTSFDFHAEVNGITYEFTVDQELDDSLKGKEVGASEKETIEDELDNNAKKKRQIGVGQIKRISGTKITTYLEGADSTDLIPN